MKKVLVTIGTLALIAAPMIAFAQLTPPDECCTLNRTLNFGSVALTCAQGTRVGPDVAATCAAGVINCPQQGWGMFCTFNTLYNIINWVFIVLIVIVALFVVMGAFMFTTSAGDPEKTKSARNYIMYAAIGLLIAFLAKAIPGIVRMVSGF